MATLLVTNDFPPTVGGIQSYLRDFVSTVAPERIIIFASTQDAAEAQQFDVNFPYEVIRWPRKVMLPTPATARAIQKIIRERGIDTVWFGAAAPLAVMGSAARAAGATRVVSTTHGHEVGWSMIPGARQVLSLIGRSSDVVTYISEYTLNRFRNAVGTQPDYVRLPSGVDTEYFRPATAQQRAQTRERFGIGERPLIVCASRLVPRKGQDQLIRAMTAVTKNFPDAQLVIVGKGYYDATLKALAKELPHNITFTGAVPRDDLRDLVAAADIASMPSRTRGGGLDVEGLGIVYLEAQACGVPVVAGNSGGSPETVTPETGIVVDGNNQRELEEALLGLLGDAPRREAMGAAGRRHVCEQWTWDHLGKKLNRVLEGEAAEAVEPGDV
ncbi:glycosyltransferase family 4 protein [Corynebacterium lubricantis]|uniref:glycosyltransferase family 4 protein n=1 Tax=Corynebacterium lubricantis TaxID=541095 RepID=UPI000380496A|nr:glycosyltransferase family 4 protein [Corynebacterium lubricantis]